MSPSRHIALFTAFGLISGAALASDAEPVTLPEPKALSESRDDYRETFERLGYRFLEGGFICPKGFLGGSTVPDGLCGDTDGALVHSRPRMSGQNGTDSVDIIGPPDAVTDVVVSMTFMAGDRPGWAKNILLLNGIAKRLSGSDAYADWLVEALPKALDGRDSSHRHGVRSMTLSSVDASDLGFITVFMTFKSLQSDDFKQRHEAALNLARSRRSLELARQARDAGDLDDAAHHYRRAERSDETRQEARIERAKVHLAAMYASSQTQDHDKALTHFHEAQQASAAMVGQTLAEDTGTTDALESLVTGLRAERPQQALEVLDLHPEWRPDLTRDVLLAAAAHRCDDQALTYYDRALLDGPEAALSHDAAGCSATLGHGALSGGDADKATSYHERGLAYDSESDDVRDLGKAIKRDGRDYQPEAYVAMGGLIGGIGMAVPTLVFLTSATKIQEDLQGTVKTTAEVDALIAKGQQAQTAGHISAAVGVGLMAGSYGWLVLQSSGEGQGMQLAPMLGQSQGLRLGMRF